MCVYVCVYIYIYIYSHTRFVMKSHNKIKKIDLKICVLSILFIYIYIYIYYIYMYVYIYIYIYMEIYRTSPGGNTLQNNSCTATYYPSRKLSKLDEPDMRDTAGEVRTNSEVIYSCGPLHMDKQRQDDQLEPIYNSSVPIQDIALKTSREWWMIERVCRRGSERFVLAARHDDDDIYMRIMK